MGARVPDRHRQSGAGHQCRHVGDPRHRHSVPPDASSRSVPTLLRAFVSDLPWRKAARGAEHRTPAQPQKLGFHPRGPMSPLQLNRRVVVSAVGVVAAAGLVFACQATRPKTTNLAAGDVASKVYVAPGQYDEFYSFLSGGFSGQVAVYGLPSGRLLKVIPVFSQNPENGYGYNDESKEMLQTTFGAVPWDDSHHPELSQTDGIPDGRWLFINANNTPRVARIDLTRFETDEILQIPNAAGGHASPFTTPNTKYIVSATRFSVPIGAKRDVGDLELQGELQGHALLHHGRSAGQDGHRLPDPHAGVQLRPRPRRQGSVRRLVLLHVVQLGAGVHEARGERVAERQGLRRRGELQEGRGMRRVRQGEDGAGRLRPQLHRPEVPHRDRREEDEREDAGPAATARASSTTCPRRSRRMASMSTRRASTSLPGASSPP